MRRNAGAGRRPGAAFAQLALAAINLPGVLEIAKFAVRLHIVAQDDPPAAIASVSVALIAGTSRRRARRRPCRGQAPRADAGAEQRLAHIDIAKPGDDPLVQQRRLDRRALAGSAADSTAGVNASPSGSGPRPASSLWRPPRPWRTRSSEPNRRGSTKPTRQPSSVSSITCSCSVGGSALAGPISMRPDMPRCISTAIAAGRAASRCICRGGESRAPARRSAAAPGPAATASAGPAGRRARARSRGLQPRLQAAHHGFDFGEFRHGCAAGYRCRTA